MSSRGPTVSLPPEVWPTGSTELKRLYREISVYAEALPTGMRMQHLSPTSPARQRHNSTPALQTRPPSTRPPSTRPPSTRPPSTRPPSASARVVPRSPTSAVFPPQQQMLAIRQKAENRLSRQSCDSGICMEVDEVHKKRDEHPREQGADRGHPIDIAAASETLRKLEILMREIRMREDDERARSLPAGLGHSSTNSRPNQDTLSPPRLITPTPQLHRLVPATSLPVPNVLLTPPHTPAVQRASLPLAQQPKPKTRLASLRTPVSKKAFNAGRDPRKVTVQQSVFDDDSDDEEALPSNLSTTIANPADKILNYALNLKFGLDSDDGASNSACRSAVDNFISDLEWAIAQSRGDTLAGNGPTVDQDRDEPMGSGYRSSVTSSRSSEQFSPAKGPTGGKRKARKISDDRDDEPDEDDTRGVNTASGNGKRARVDPPFRMTCPYRRKNPLRFNVRDHRLCATTIFTDVAELRRHIQDFHKRPAASPFKCLRCYSPFRTEDELRQHQLYLDGLCPIRPDPGHAFDPEDGIDDLTAKQLRCKKGRVADPIHVQWQKIWGLLFPGTEVLSYEYCAVIEHNEAFQGLRQSIPSLLSALSGEGCLYDEKTDEAEEVIQRYLAEQFAHLSELGKQKDYRPNFAPDQGVELMDVSEKPSQLRNRGSLVNRRGEAVVDSGVVLDEVIEEAFTVDDEIHRNCPQPAPENINDAQRRSASVQSLHGHGKMIGHIVRPPSHLGHVHGRSGGHSASSSISHSSSMTHSPVIWQPSPEVLGGLATIHDQDWDEGNHNIGVFHQSGHRQGVVFETESEGLDFRCSTGSTHGWMAPGSNLGHQPMHHAPTPVQPTAQLHDMGIARDMMPQWMATGESTLNFI